MIMKQCTKYEISSYTDYGDIVEGRPNFLGVTWLGSWPLSEIICLSLVGMPILCLCLVGIPIWSSVPNLRWF